MLKGKAGKTPSLRTVSTKLQQLAEQASRDPTYTFTTLAHLMDVNFLREAYTRTRKDGAPGVDEVTAEEYGRNLEANLAGLHERLREGRYQAPPVKRAYVPKENGKQRPIGLPGFEDKIVQRSVAMLLGAIYEQDFKDFSYGFREGRNPHQALSEVRERSMNDHIGWIIDADVSAFFDNLDHDLLREMIQQRIKDGAILRLIGKWLNAGVLEGETLSYPGKGSPQGGVISPLLANIFLHHVLDEWYEREVMPRMKGRVYLVRFADDFVIGCELEEDANRIMEVLPKRFARYKLSIHPEKSRLVRFQPPRPGGRGGGGETFDFLGLTHYWGRSRRGNWVIKRRTAKNRLRRAMRSLWDWCRDHRHEPILEQRKSLSQKLRGHYQYYGIRGNYRMMSALYESAQRAWKRWLNRRGGKRTMEWERFVELWALQQLPRPRIVHDI